MWQYPLTRHRAIYVKTNKQKKKDIGERERERERSMRRNDIYTKTAPAQPVRNGTGKKHNNYLKFDYMHSMMIYLPPVLRQ
jgi:hypothetical protein